MEYEKIRMKIRMPKKYYQVKILYLSLFPKTNKTPTVYCVPQSREWQSHLSS